MEKEVRIAYIGLQYWNPEDREFYGDMGYAFNDEADSRVLEANGYEDLRKGCAEWVNDPNSSDESAEKEGESYAVYEIHTATATYDTEDFDGNEIDADGNLTSKARLWSLDIESDTDEITEVYVNAPRAIAESAIKEEYGMWVTAHYKGE